MKKLTLLVIGVLLLTYASSAQKLIPKAYINPAYFILVPFDAGGSLEFVATERSSLQASVTFHLRPPTVTLHTPRTTQGYKLILGHRLYFSPKRGANGFYLEASATFANVDVDGYRGSGYDIEECQLLDRYAYFFGVKSMLGYQIIGKSRLTFDVQFGSEIGQSNRIYVYENCSRSTAKLPYLDISGGIALGFAIGKINPHYSSG